MLKISATAVLTVVAMACFATAAQAQTYVIKDKSKIAFERRVAHDCYIAGTVQINQKGLAVRSVIRNSSRYRGQTGGLIVAAYDRAGNLLGKHVQTAGINAKGWGRTKRRDLNFDVIMPPSETSKVHYVKVHVFDKNTNRALKEFTKLLAEVISALLTDEEKKNAKR